MMEATVLERLLPLMPYMVRAIYEWLLDNGLTPYLLVDVNFTGVQVPNEHAKDNKMILNVHPDAINKLRIGNDALECQMRFNGVVRQIFIPIAAILALYAQENGAGLVFSDSDRALTAAQIQKDIQKEAEARSAELVFTLIKNKTKIKKKKSVKSSGKPVHLSVLPGGKKE